jgi:hypothetical protein
MISKSDDLSWKDTVETPVEGTSSERSQTEEPIISAAGVAKTVNRAINDTAQKYFTAAGIKVDLEDIQNKIRDRPLFYLAIAAGAGFVIGGGMASKMGVALIGLVGRKAAAETTTNLGRQVLRQAAGAVQASV